jgi:prepilin-type N-terminal cleavage/methylation domain-containing protein
MNQRNGFTLIELLVVIAIIALLAAVVIASLSMSRAKGNDTAIKRQLQEAVSQGELYYNGNNLSYASVCTSTTGVAPLFQKAAQIAEATVVVNGAAQTTTTANCNDSATTYAMSIKLKQFSTPTYWCMDSTGKRIQTTTALASGVTICQ